MNQTHTFILNNSNIPFEFTLKIGNKIGEIISNQLINSRKYNVQSNVSEENFKIFLDFLNEKIQYPDINAENYYDFFLLSKEFNNILSNHLSKPEFTKICTISMLDTAIKKDIINKNFCEEYIAENLDDFLAFYEEKMSDIPITTLYNIFNHKKRVLNNQERAYQFIKKYQSKSDNNNENNNGINSFCILYETIDATKINEESFNECFAQKDEHCGFVPKLQFSFISSFNKNLCDLKNQMENKFDQTFRDFAGQQMQVMNEMKSLFTSLSKQSSDTFNDIKNLTESIKTIQNEIKEIRDSNEKTQLNVQQISNKSDELKNDIKILSETIKNIDGEVKQVSPKYETTQAKITSLSDNVKVIQNKIIEISNTDTETKNKVQQIYTKNEEIQNKVINISDKVVELKNDSAQIQRKCDDAYSCVQQFPNKFSEIEKSSKQILDKVSKTLSLTLANTSSFEGIIRQLTEACGGNVSDKGVVYVTASSKQDGDHYLPKNAVDLDNSSNCFGSSNLENSWLKYDFIYKKVRPTGYLIRSRDTGKGNYHPMSWVIEGSNSDSSNDWEILDSRNNITSLDDSCAVQAFPIHKNSQFYRYLRIRQTGKNSKGNDYFELSALEYFGSIQ